MKTTFSEIPQLKTHPHYWDKETLQSSGTKLLDLDVTKRGDVFADHEVEKTSWCL